LIAGVSLTFLGTFGFRKHKELKSRVPFEIRISMVTRPLPAYVVEAQGDLLNKGDEVSYTLNLQDRTGGTVSPLLFKSEGAEKTYATLKVNGPALKVSPRERLSEWTRIVTLPAERVSFSHQGKRELTFSLQVEGAPVTAEDVMTTEQVEVGFVEVREKLPDIYASIWYLIAGLRSDFPEHSALILERAAEFLVKESESWPSKIRTEIFNSFRDIAETETPSISCEEVCKTYAVSLQSTADNDTRDDVMRLFYTLLIDENGLNVEPEDGLLVFYNLCVGIGIDMGAFTRLVDRLVLSNDLTDLPSGCLLGLHVGMDLKAAKARLMEEYKKWNTRTTHSDENIKERAKYMMELISSARVALK
jgi:hypothetical protein